MRILFAIVTAGLLFSCSSLERKGGDVREPLVIRYFSLQAVYAVVAERNSELKAAVMSRDAALKSVKSAEEQMLLAPGKQELLKKLSDEREKLEKTDKKITYIKAKIYSGINRAVKIVAENTGADFILNIGDELLYSKKKYDITEDVIREINKIEYHSLPVNR